MITPKCIKGTIYFDPKDPIYKVHFPSFPVVPGSLIIAAFLEAVEAVKPTKKKLLINNFNFLRFVKPGTCDYIIEIDKTQWQCHLFQNERPVAKGKISYGS
ncbi:hydroxymyristoyl-ACP dehydratase [Candidatus Magnetomorum sp. HK-1]|nr:hydroxymyristoyl-ACP dehydratase [Candidatus Magnetomorum sp. HK-1]